MKIVKRRYLPNAFTRDALSVAVESQVALDVNLKLFDMIGRMALTGIWLLFLLGHRTDYSDDEQTQIESELNEYTNGIISIINNNGILRTPISDAQSTEIGLVCQFLMMRRREDAIRDWTSQVLQASVFAIATNTAYPCVHSDYQELAEHPKSRSDEDYFKRATAGSTLIPTLMVWKLLCDPDAKFIELAKFVSTDLPHCTMQLWVPNDASEKHFYTNTDTHGFALVGLPISDEADEMLEIVSEEIKNSKHVFSELSAIKFGHWPIVLSACRHHRLPIPVNFWEGLLPNHTKEEMSD